MAVSALMSIAMRAMSAQQATLQTTGHNIANAHVDGYSRQSATLATAQGQFTGAGFFGKGVNVVSVQRSYNAYLTREAVSTRAVSAMDEARLRQLSQLERAFPGGEQGLGYAATSLLNAISDLASRPSDMASRQVVLARSEDLARRFSSAQADLEALQVSTNEELGTAVETINQLARNIAAVNEKIAAVNGLGQPPNDLLDERDRYVAQLSEQIQVNTMLADDGTLGVFTAGGQNLVLSNRAQQMRVVADSADPSRSAVAILDNGLPRVLPQSVMGGGRVAGLLEFQNRDLVDARTRIGQLAAAIGGTLNAQQRLGMNLHEPAGAVPAADLFAIGAPRAVAAASNQRDAFGAFVGSVGLTVTSPTELRASEYELREDGGGGWQLTRLSDGLVRAVADGDEVDGFRIDFGAPPPQAGDKFLLQPVSHAGLLTSLLTDPRDLAAASPLTVTFGASNSGSAAVASFAVTSDAVDPQNTASISFTDDSGSYAWELRDRDTNALVASGTGTWVPGEPIPATGDPDINGFRLELSGVPRSGDTLTIEKTPYPATNNGNALAMAALRDGRIVGRERAADGSLVGGATTTDAWAAAMSDMGVRVQGAEALAEISTALADQAEAARTAESGVNLDEEAARLIEFQQSYQAAAKVLQVAQSLFDTLLQAAA